jgi:DNA (cytosine-5)-methyltransferase 1
MPVFSHGFKNNPATRAYRHPQLSGEPPRPEDVRVVSLFAGCGGLDLGILGGFLYGRELYESLPFRIVAAYDIDSQAVETYRLNLSDDIFQADLTTVDMAELPPADLLLGGFPCQDFSSSGPKQGLVVCQASIAG